MAGCNGPTGDAELKVPVSALANSLVYTGAEICETDWTIWGTSPVLDWAPYSIWICPVLAGDYTRNNAARKIFDPKLYNPSRLDTDQWEAAAKSAGTKYAIFTATHINGFMQWQSDLYPYGCKQAAWRDGKGDVVGDFVTSCRKFGIKPKIYFSTHRNVYHTVWRHFVDWGKGQGGSRQTACNRIAEKMTEELCSIYGELLQIW